MPDTESPAERVPRIGDIVLYHHFDAGRLLALAALVVHVERPGEPRSDVFLTVFRPGRTPEPHNSAIPFAEEPTNGYWSWREDG
jgi:hypothetical protein